MMKLLRLIVICLSTLLTNVYAQNDLFSKLANTSEIISNAYTEKELEKIYKKLTPEQIQHVINDFESVVSRYLNQVEINDVCPEQVSTLLEKKPQLSFREQLILVRSRNLIDDILFDILSLTYRLNDDFHFNNYSLEGLYSHLSNDHNIRVRNGSSSYSRHKVKRRIEELTHRVDLKALYLPVINATTSRNCIVKKWLNLSQKFSKKIKGFKPLDLKLLNHAAKKQRIISDEIFKYLELTRSRVEKHTLSFTQYLNSINGAKNKLKPYSYRNQEIILSDDNFANYQKRSSALTKRKELYFKYSPTQIILLAQVLQRASRRMGVDPDVESSAPVIVQEFQERTPKGEVRNYVEKLEMDPKSQYDYARKRLRADILKVKSMMSFRGKGVKYEDIVMAALETGYITTEEVQYVLAYDDLWNPERSSWDQMKQFLLRFATTGSLYLPPPWNVTGAIALVVLQTKLAKNNRKGKHNDNPGEIY